jgi:predicted ABC-type ATPase
VEEHIVRRRYTAGVRNLFKLYLPVVDYFILIDNSVVPREVVAEGSTHDVVKVYNEEKFKLIRQI